MREAPVATPSVSVIICAYTQNRWQQLQATVDSVVKQSIPANEIIVVVDHNSALKLQACAELPNAKVIENTGTKGLSGARNSGVASASSSVVAFLDDDAVADSDWLAQLMLGYQAPTVVGVGGLADPIWPSQQPSWFPEEFLWVLGCSHLGTPQEDASVRNFIGCNMSFRRTVFHAVGDFRTEMGRIGTYPAGCEETELCIRIKQSDPQKLLLYKPSARVKHHVTESRLTTSYFLQRCFAEGLSKAQVSMSVGTKDSLATERAYTFKVLPLGIVRNLKQAGLERDPMKLARAGNILIGFGATVAGYVKGAVSAKMNKAKRKVQTPGTHEASPFVPRRIFEVDITEPLPDLAASDVKSGLHYTRACIFVRRHAQPLGFIEVELGDDGIGATELVALIRTKLGIEVQSTHKETSGEQPTLGVNHLNSKRLLVDVAAAAGLPFVSVIIATHNRTASLASCLASLERLTYPNYEVIVVDNAPSTSETFDYIQHTFSSTQIRYVREDTPGLAVAHNRGLHEARGEIVAFTDDDVRIDQHWLNKLVEGFTLAANVGCVTGMIVPAELETPAQAWLEQYGGFNKGFEVSMFNLTDHRPQNPLYPYTAGVFGSGANMAFRKDVLQAIGGFDPALGAGSKGVGGDDLAAFFDVVKHGHTLVYQPAAIVHHWHRRDYEGLRNQAYGYGVGLTAFLTKTIIDQPQRLFDILPRVPQALFYAFSPTSSKNAKKQADYPKELSRLERKGMLYGPVAYIRSRWNLRKLEGYT